VQTHTPLKGAYLVSTAMNDAEGAGTGIPCRGDSFDKLRRSLRPAADFDDSSHAGKPIVSSRPSMMFAF
jgi:hypothetical protein